MCDRYVLSQLSYRAIIQGPFATKRLPKQYRLLRIARPTQSTVIILYTSIELRFGTPGRIRTLISWLRRPGTVQSAGAYIGWWQRIRTFRVLVNSQVPPPRGPATKNLALASCLTWHKKTSTKQLTISILDKS